MNLPLRSVYPFLAGLVASLGNAPITWSIFTLIGIGFAVYLFSKENSFYSSFKVGYFFGAGYFLVTLSWLIFPFLVEPDKTGWMAPFALVLTALGLSLFWGISFGIPNLWKNESKDKFLVLAVCWVAFELLREYLFTGFPWGLFAYTLDGTPIIQVTSLIGANGLTALIIFLAIIPFLWKHFGQGIGMTIVVLTIIWFWGWQRVPAETEYTSSGELIRIVQPNIPQRDKWDPILQSEFFNLLLDLSNSPSDNEIGLVIWPETAITVFVDEEDMAYISSKVNNTPLISGFRRFIENRMYNSLMVLNSNGTLHQVYDKQHLVPFGEFIPFEGILKWVMNSGLANDEIWDFSEGTGSRFLTLPVLGKVRALICYEAIFPHEVRTRERPDTLLQITNDAWIGNSWGPQQHFVIAKARSTELGLPLVRVSNNGVSAIVDGFGRSIEMLDTGTVGILDTQIPKSLPPTIYSKVGDWPLVIFLFLLGVCLLIRSKIITNNR